MYFNIGRKKNESNFLVKNENLRLEQVKRYISTWGIPWTVNCISPTYIMRLPQKMNFIARVFPKISPEINLAASRLIFKSKFTPYYGYIALLTFELSKKCNRELQVIQNSTVRSVF